MEIFYKELNLINILQCNAFKEWDNLKISKDVSFSLYNEEEDDTSFEKDLIRVKCDNVIVGMLPKDETVNMRSFIKQGWTDVFMGKICKTNNEADYDNRIKIAVYIKQPTTKCKCPK